MSYKYLPWINKFCFFLRFTFLHCQASKMSGGTTIRYILLTCFLIFLHGLIQCQAFALAQEGRKIAASQVKRNDTGLDSGNLVQSKKIGGTSEQISDGGMDRLPKVIRSGNDLGSLIAPQRQSMRKQNPRKDYDPGKTSSDECDLHIWILLILLFCGSSILFLIPNIVFCIKNSIPSTPDGGMISVKII